MRLSDLLFGKEKLPPKGTKIELKTVFSTGKGLDAYDSGADSKTLHGIKNLKWMILASDLRNYLDWVKSQDDVLHSNRVRKSALRRITLTGPVPADGIIASCDINSDPIYAVAFDPFRITMVRPGRAPFPGEWYYEKDLLAFLEDRIQEEREDPNLAANPLADHGPSLPSVQPGSLMDHIIKSIENERNKDNMIKAIFKDLIDGIQATSKPFVLTNAGLNMLSPTTPRPPLSKIVHDKNTLPTDTNLCMVWTEDGFLYLLPSSTPSAMVKTVKWAYLDDIIQWMLQGLATDPETGDSYDEDLAAFVHSKDEPIKYKTGAVMAIRLSDQRVKWIGMATGGKPSYDLENADYWCYELDFMQFIDARLEEEANPVQVTFTPTEPKPVDKGDLIRFQDARVKQVIHVQSGGENQPERFIIKLANLNSNEHTIVTTEYAEEAQKFKAGKVYRFSVNELE